MIGNNELISIGFSANKYYKELEYQSQDYIIRPMDGKLKLCEWCRNEDIDVSHLGVEQLKTLISLLTKPTNED